MHTFNSWDFIMMLEKNDVVRMWDKANYGEDIIIANLDSRVWPESESFTDDGSYGPIPAKWKGSCQNNTRIGVPCNKKLIGAKHIMKGYLSQGGKIPADMNSPPDFVDHGTHTLSTVERKMVPAASVFGMINGTTKGGVHLEPEWLIRSLAKTN
ncbi:hypothetical protein CsSME_00032847 [Camellia sinensis var. sinensis]